MKMRLEWSALCALAVYASVLTGCSEEDHTDGVTSCGPKFVLATTITTSAGDTNVLLTAESLDEGTVSAIGNGCTNDGATQWIFNGDYAYGLTYNQANAGTTHRFVLRPTGQIEADPTEYFVSRFSSYGLYENYIFSTATGDGNPRFADSNNYVPQTLTFTRIDCNGGSSKPNDTSTDNRYSVENYVGNGEYVTLCGIEQFGNRIASGLAPMGLSQYGVADNNGNWVLPENEDLVTKTDGGTGGGSYKANTLSGTQYPDMCYVALYDDETLTNPTIISTDKISTPAGRFRSQYYQSIWTADDGALYVFSPSYARTQTDKRQRCENPAGVMRILPGTDKFDANYYCDLEDLSGGYSFMRNWYISGPYFLMQMYDQKLTPSARTLTALSLAIFDASKQTLTKVALPDNVSSIGKTIYVNNGNVYIPVNVENDYPAIYRINPVTAEATKGLTVEVTTINGMGYMTPVE
ncbi:MAG: DUF4374 domain-containing protein [Muribaculaceae bacterium]|nr:DUF4374 domain-containing protein [Muribaculaceae bacterium]